MKYLNEDLWGEICKLGAAQGMTEGAPPSSERVEYIKKAGEVKLRLHKQLTKVDEIFYEPLSLQH